MDDNEAYWASLVVATAMLGSGFSLLLFPMFTGYGAVILSLGIMTMIVVLMTKAVIIQIQKWMDYNARIEETVANILAMRLQVAPIQTKTETLKAGDGEPHTDKLKVESSEEAEIEAT